MRCTRGYAAIPSASSEMSMPIDKLTGPQRVEEVSADAAFLVEAFK
jgi:hypothetical protein